MRDLIDSGKYLFLTSVAGLSLRLEADQLLVRLATAGLLAAFADLSQPVLSPSDPSNPSSLQHPQHAIQLEHDPYTYENQLGLGPELQHLTQDIRGTSHQPSPEPSAPIPKTNKKRKKTSTKDPNANQVPKRPKPLPKKDKVASAKVSEKGVDSEGGSAEQPVVMPTRKEVQTILDERYKTQRRLFFKMAGLTGGPGRPTTKRTSYGTSSEGDLRD